MKTNLLCKSLYSFWVLNTSLILSKHQFKKNVTQKVNLVFFLFLFSIQIGVCQSELDPNFTAKFLSESNVSSIKTQVDGKILAAGDLDYANGHISLGVCRYNEDGTPDLSFSTGKGPNDFISCMAVQNDGKIILGGSFTSFNDFVAPALVRLNTDGSVDTSFDVGTGFNSDVLSLAVDSENRILVGGWFNTVDGVTSIGLVRLNNDGSIDNTFMRNTSGNGNFRDIEFQSDGKIIIMNQGSNYLGNGDDILRLNNDGSIDTTFVLGLARSIPSRFAFDVLSDDRIVWPCRYEDNYGVLVLGANGAFDGFFSLGEEGDFYRDVVVADSLVYFGVDEVISFNLNSETLDTLVIADDINGFFWSYGLHPDGTLLCGGAFYTESSTNTSLLKVDENENLDLTFNTDVTCIGDVKTICIEESGKILVGGDFLKVNGSISHNLTRLNSDGSTDADFELVDWHELEIVNDIALLNGGSQILVATNFSSDPTLAGAKMINSDGSPNLDFNFDLAAGTGGISELWISPDEEGFYANTYGFFGSGIFVPGLGTRRSAYISLTSGIPDANFASLNTVEHIEAISFSPDNKILLAGGFGSFLDHDMIRMNEDWTNDNTFSDYVDLEHDSLVSNQDPSVFSILELENNKILISGIFTDVNNSEVGEGLARINSDGSLDESFDTGTGFGYDFGPLSTISQIELLRSDQYLIRGQFSDFNGTPVSDMCVINSDGNLVDYDFKFFSGEINDIEVIDTSTIFAAGPFILESGSSSIGIAKFLLTDTPITVDVEDIIDENITFDINIFPNPTTKEVSLTLSDVKINEKFKFEIYNEIGELIFVSNLKSTSSELTNTISLENTFPGTYFLKVNVGDKSIVEKLIKI